MITKFRNHHLVTKGLAAGTTVTAFALSFAIAYAQAECTEGPNCLQPSAAGNVGVRIAAPAGINAPTSLASVVRIIVRGFFLVGGILVVIMLLWGAVEWILSGGNKEKVNAARGRIVHALIGLVILALAFVIARVVGTAVGFDVLNPPEINSLSQ